MNRRGLMIGGVVVLTLLLVLYASVVVIRSIDLISTGHGVGIALGLAFLVIPLVLLALLTREWRLAWDTQVMADTLAAEDGLPVDDLPRSPGGRIDKTAAREAFDAVRRDTEATPDDWRAWYKLAFAYDAAGDRSRARSSLRTAARLRRTT